MVRVSRSARRRSVASATGNNSGSILSMQPKLEPQPIVFDQQQTKMIPIAPRYDSNNQINSSLPQPTTTVYTCSSCNLPIHERYYLRTYDRLSHESFWHMQCLRCQHCDAVLADLATTFYAKDNGLFCKSDYIKIYGSRPCSSCSQVIGTNEQIMRVSPNYVYHLSCFNCAKCHIRLVKGDRYVFFNGQLFCEKDNPHKSTTNNNNNNNNNNNTSVTKRGTTSKRGAKSSRATTQVQQSFVTQTQYHHTGHMSLLNNPHQTSTITHSLLNNNNSNGSSSILIPTGDELF